MNQLSESTAVRQHFGGVSLNRLLVRLLGHPRTTQVIKWLVYGALTINLLIYAFDDYNAFRSSLPAGAPLNQILEKFSTTIDTAAWLGLVLLFEIETYLLPETAHRAWSTLALGPARVVCYALIAAATYGYLTDLLDYRRAAPVSGLTDLCALADQGAALQTDSISYAEITVDNCGTLSSDSSFFQIPDEVSVMGGAMLTHVRSQARLNMVNALTWLLVVLLIEVELRLQSAQKFASNWLTRARQLLTLGYGVLIVIALIWLFTGYPIYTWDAFLWIAGFWAIELNLAEWEHDHLAQIKPVAEHG